MAPSSSAITGSLRQIIYYHLDNSAYDNALFFAERLAAHDPRSSESAFIFALCHLRVGDYRSAYEISKPAGYRGIHLGCAFVFGQACLHLERCKDGITGLEKSRGLWSHKHNVGKHSACTRMPHPDAAAAACLLGKLYRAYDDKKKAVALFEEALKANPFMWDAFTNLCDMGASVRVPNIFRLSEPLTHSFDQDPTGIYIDQKDSMTNGPLAPVQKKPPLRSVLVDTADPFDSQRSTAFQDISFSNLMSPETEENDFMAKINLARSRLAANANVVPVQEGMETPTGPAAVVDTNITRASYQADPPQAPMRKSRAQATESGFVDAPPKMSVRFGTKRRERERILEKGAEQSVEVPSTAPAEPPSRPLSTSIPAAERKRTVSGHPVQPRHAAADESGVGQRRSARLHMFNRSTGVKASSGAATVGPAATRDLKRARPPVSRIIRPGSSGSSVGRVVSGNRKPLEENGMEVDHAEMAKPKEVAASAPEPKPIEHEGVKVEESLRWLLDLLKKFGAGYSLLTQYQCQEALQAYSSLPRAHQDTPWVLAQQGRAQYEQAGYAEAEKFFRRLRILAPTRLQDMEVYSTILWFLKRETDLSFLAHELVDSAWHSPQAWCALGNAWSLALDHEQALRCFKRATQLDPKFAYAFTLQGHEHVLNEEYEKALTAYRNAISADRRHYNAYYGIGKVYEKLGNYEKAYMHYHAASVIHPTNAVLICCIGNVLEKQKQVVQALQYFSKATELAPRAAQTRFKKARALLAIKQLDAAHRELMILKDLAPDEARVHFLLGKLYKTMNDKSAAVRHFTIALSLDPKASQQIKEAIESLEDDDGFDDSMMG